METEPSLLQRYRRDRRKLLEFLLSSGLIKEIRTPFGPSTSISDINFDVLSADYVLECIQSGGVIDIAKATAKYNDESAYPIAIHFQSGDSYFLLTNLESAGSPPTHAPPLAEVNNAYNFESCSSHNPNAAVGQKLAMSGNECGVNHLDSINASSEHVKIMNISSLGLPILKTGLSDDDLRESAYEILLACLVSSGKVVYSVEERKKEKGSRFLAGLKNKRDKRHQQSHCSGIQSELIDTVRVQMQISEGMDACIKQILMQFASRKRCGQIDIPQLLLDLLHGISKSTFFSDKSYMQWKKRQANMLEEILLSGNNILTEQQTTVVLLDKVRKAEEWDIIMSPSDRAEVLTAIRHVTSVLSFVPGHFGIKGETCYWKVCYHLNIRLYEKLLLGVFDILEEGQLIEEADEILKLIKLTWSTLGIIQKIHHALYGWVLFRQFIETEEGVLLDHAILEVQKAASSENYDRKDDQYMSSLMCCPACHDSEIQLSLMQAIFNSMSLWCDSKLQDYHLHFSQKPLLFGRVMTIASVVESYSGFVTIKMTKSVDIVKKFRSYIERSIEAACKRVANTVNQSETESKHLLALLAGELSLVAKRELTEYCPVLCRWFSEAGIVSAILIHQFYGERLKPFIEELSCLSEDAKSVLSAADMLESDLIQIYDFEREENGFRSSSIQVMKYYQIGEISKPFVLDWVIAQHMRILEWTGRAFDLEHWECLSCQQKHAASAVEVFRIIEETVDQFFGLNLPMDTTHLKALVSIIFHTLDSYLVKMISQLVEKHNLYPSVPSLTRNKEAAFPIMKKKLIEHVHLDMEVHDKLIELTACKLCIKLNTLQYIQKQIGILEDGIRKSWASVRPFKNHAYSGKEPPGNQPMCSESVDELFVATFDSILDTASDAISRICNFIGARVVFWDLRDSFLFGLYRGSVEAARLDSILPHFDRVLNLVCDLIDVALRDLVVSSIFKASLEAYVWVLLDGGPSRAFSDSDILMMEDDLNILKELFVADGEGLPRSFVEEEAKFTHHILCLFSLQTESVIQMLMTASEYISTAPDSHKNYHRCWGDAHTLVRVLCHKKDREASRFLKKQYQLPASSEYDDTPGTDSSLKPPLVTDLLTRTASFRWSENSHSSFRSIKKRLQEATSDLIRAAQ